MNNETSQVSVIMPVYNGEKYIEQTLRSLLNCLNFSELEIIVINDGSNDGTRKILEKFLDQIIILDQNNSGQASAINKGFEIAKGKYCSIVNSDDPILNPFLFKESVKILEMNKDLIATYPDWVIIDNEGNEVKKILVKEYSENELIGRFNCIIGPGGVFRTNKAIEVGGWDKTYRYVPDYDFWLKLSRFGEFKRIPQFYCAWRSHNNSISVKDKGKEMADERIRVMENFVQNNKISSNLRKSGVAYAYHSAALLCFFDNRVQGKKFLWQAILNYPMIIFKTSIKSNLFITLYPLSKKITTLLKIKPKF
jgi:glycosyltransferase involved in cell wall biosynthesis